MNRFLDSYLRQRKIGGFINWLRFSWFGCLLHLHDIGVLRYFVRVVGLGDFTFGLLHFSNLCHLFPHFKQTDERMDIDTLK